MQHVDTHNAKEGKNVTVSHGMSLGIDKDEPANHKTNK